jgi:hypothetical protein
METQCRRHSLVTSAVFHFPKKTSPGQLRTNNTTAQYTYQLAPGEHLARVIQVRVQVAEAREPAILKTEPRYTDTALQNN